MSINKQVAAALLAAAAVAAMAAGAIRDPDRWLERVGTHPSPDRSQAAAVRATGGRPAGAPGSPAAAAEGEPLSLDVVAGGDLGQPLVVGPRVYVPVGRTLALWDYSHPGAPRRIATSDPAPGVIQALARHGKYIYASWREGSCRRGGVAVYMSTLREGLRLVGGVADYAGEGASHTCAAGVAVAKGRLYLFDTDHGLFVASLADPGKPVLEATAVGPGPATRVNAAGNLLWASGRNFFGEAQFRSIDISVPDAPQEAAFWGSTGTAIMNVNHQAPYVYGFGHALSVIDMSDPSQIRLVGSAEMPYGAWTGFRLGDHVYSGGGLGLDVWSVASPSQPMFVANHPLRTFAARDAVALNAGYGLMLGTDDRMVAVDGRDPEAPAIASQRLQTGGVQAMDVAQVGGYAVLLQYDYGLTVADPVTLAPLVRFEPELPDVLQARAYSGMAVAGHLAYLAAWGYGLIVVDLSDPLAPREIARMPYPFPGSVEVEGNRLYLGRNTDEKSLAVVDIADPTKPALLSVLPLLDVPWDMAAKGTVVFAAEPGSENVPIGGVRVLDATDPNAIVDLGRWEGDCQSATGLSLDAGRDRLYVSCRAGLRILDVSNPASPQLIGGADDGGAVPSTFTAVAARGDRAWYASAEGIVEFDVSVPGTPQLLKRTPLAGYEPIALRTMPDGGLIATTWSAGVHVMRAQ